MEPIQIENLDAVTKRISNAGFSSSIVSAVSEGLAAGQTEIRPFVSEIIENKRMDFEPEIKIKENKGYYNGFKATFYNEDGSTVNQWFKAADRITINEAFILMMDQQHPRAVHKTYYNDKGEKYGQWIQLDFSQKTESGNYLLKRHGDFDQVAKLEDYNFLELDSEKQKITAATYMAEGREIELTPANQETYPKVYVRANPERNTFTFMDGNGTLLYHDQFRTQVARERIQQEKNNKQSNVSFVRNSKEGPFTEKTNDIKKKSEPEQEQLKSNKKPRQVLEMKAKKGKAL